MANEYGAGRPRGFSTSPRRVKKFLHVVQTGSGDPRHPVGTGGPFPGVNRQGREADHSPTTAEFKKTWVYTYIPPYVFMA
jgi:hypothetical protein